jgi:hypothetical protein
MQFSDERPSPVTDRQPNAPPNGKKPYSAPKLRILRPDEAVAALKAKGLPGDPVVQKLLALMERRGSD